MVELARKADAPYTTLTKIETGVIKKPSVYVVAKIAKALNIFRRININYAKTILQKTKI